MVPVEEHMPGFFGDIAAQGADILPGVHRANDNYRVVPLLLDGVDDGQETGRRGEDAPRFGFDSKRSAFTVRLVVLEHLRRILRRVVGTAPSNEAADIDADPVIRFVGLLERTFDRFDELHEDVTVFNHLPHVLPVGKHACEGSDAMRPETLSAEVRFLGVANDHRHGTSIEDDFGFEEHNDLLPVFPAQVCGRHRYRRIRTAYR